MPRMRLTPPEDKLLKTTLLLLLTLSKLSNISKVESLVESLDKKGLSETLVGDAECLIVTRESSLLFFLDKRGVKDLKLLETFRLFVLLGDEGVSLNID